jgi:hypothetical protein
MTEQFKTSDIYLAGALLSLGAKLEEVNRDDLRHMIFVFIPKPAQEHPKDVTFDNVDLRDLEKHWYNRNLIVNAFDYAEAMKRMKSIIHSRF